MFVIYRSPLNGDSSGHFPRWATPLFIVRFNGGSTSEEMTRKNQLPDTGVDLLKVPVRRMSRLLYEHVGGRG